ncbi:MAG: hypothetical protein LBJ39_04700 [Tannerellaceae bacterium]|jgi:hypothetical protein|nr:hypothetical protein [Tannerellaceae bacterium]
MKAKQFLLIACLPTLLALAGCEPIIGERPPDLHYNIYMEIVDTEGNSIVSGLVKQDFGHNDVHYVIPTYYTMKVFVDEIEVSISSNKFYFEDDDRLALAIPLERHKAVTVKYVITSFSIFKDDKEHTLTVQWENLERYSPHICKEVRFDGNVMPVTTDEYGDRATIRIVIDN